MSSDDQSDKECPLCMEAFDIDDFNFFPCNCQYQICRFCWHRIRTNENGLCPACRQSYPEDPVNFQPLSRAEVQKIKTEKKQKIQREKNKVVEGRKHLADFRVLQKNLVYAVGLSQRMADPELLKKPEFFGKFGRIIKIAVGTAQAINNNTPPTHTAYVTYARSEDALRAIQAVNNMVVDGRLLKASLGTTKYCSNFLKGQSCYKPECMYLHEVAEDEISFTKEDMHQGKHTEYERRLQEQMTNGTNQTGGQAQQNPVSNSAIQNLADGRKESTSATIVKSRINNKTADHIEKKRPMTVGSAENLAKIAQQQKHKKATNSSDGISTKAATFWDSNKVGRGGSETRELRRNESVKTIATEAKRNSKASLGSISPPTVSSVESTITNTDDREDGINNFSKNKKGVGVRNTSPISMSLSMGEPMGINGGGIPRSDSNPPGMAASISSPSPPHFSQLSSHSATDSELANGNAAITLKTQMEIPFSDINGLMDSRVPLEIIQIKSHNSSSFNFPSDHDDDLGFDPFIESAKGLEQMIEEEKHFTSPAKPSNSIISKTSKYMDNTSTASSLIDNHNMHPIHALSGLHNNQQHFGNGADNSLQNHHPFEHDIGSSTTAFGSFFGNKIHGGSSDNLSMTDLRESFKAMLPNVNVRFIPEGNNNQQQQAMLYNNQTAVNYVGSNAGSGSNNCGEGGVSSYFGAVGSNMSTSSLPSLPASHSSSRAAQMQQQPQPSSPGGHFRPFPMEQQHQRYPPQPQQQRRHPFQTMGGAGMGSLSMNNFGNTAATNGLYNSHHNPGIHGRNGGSGITAGLHNPPLHHMQQQQTAPTQQYNGGGNGTATTSTQQHQQLPPPHQMQSQQQLHFSMQPNHTSSTQQNHYQQHLQNYQQGTGGQQQFPMAQTQTEQQQQSAGGEWIPVPPGFSPRMGQ